MFKSLCLVKLHTFLPYGGALLVQKKPTLYTSPFHYKRKWSNYRQWNLVFQSIICYKLLGQPFMRIMRLYLSVLGSCCYRGTLFITKKKWINKKKNNPGDWIQQHVLFCSLCSCFYDFVFLLKKTFLIFLFHFIETAWLFDFCKVIRVI